MKSVVTTVGLLVIGNAHSADWDVRIEGPYFSTYSGEDVPHRNLLSDREFHFRSTPIADNSDEVAAHLQRLSLMEGFAEFAADLFAGRVLIGQQDQNAFTIFHSSGSQTTLPEDYSGLINVGVRIEGVTAPPTHGVTLGFKYETGNTQSVPAGYDRQLDPGSDAKIYLKFSGASFTPDLDGPTDATLSIAIKSEYIRNSKDEPVLNIIATVPFGGVFLVAARDDDRSWANRSISFTNKGSGEKFSLNGNYNTIVPPGEYSAEYSANYTLSDCGSHDEPPELNINKRWEIGRFSCQFRDRGLERDEKQKTDVMVEKGQVAVLLLRAF